MAQGFGARLQEALTRHGPLCVGIDPHPAILAEWRLPDSAAGARELGLTVVEATTGRVGVIKPQVALFEQYGAAGLVALEAVLAEARDRGLVVIGDVKRGEIGFTMTGYVRAWLDPASPLQVDAVTLSPYLGADSLQDAIRAALRYDRGAFVLAATSNPESAHLQTATTSAGVSVAASVAASVREFAVTAGELAPVGLVIGATNDRSEYGLHDELIADLPILAPGFGAQGVAPEELGGRFGSVSHQVIAAESRSVLSGDRSGIADRISARASMYR